jgi:hypothetical protein
MTWSRYRHQLGEHVLPLEAITQGSAKMRELAELLPRLCREGHRVLVFSQVSQAAIPGRGQPPPPVEARGVSSASVWLSGYLPFDRDKN